jgi:hypothetical protein
MTRVLAVIGILALLLYFRIPQRIPWDELRGFKGADSVEKTAQPLLDDLKPKQEDKALPADETSSEKDAPWMRSQCQSHTITKGARLSKPDYNRHLSSRDLQGSDPLQDGTIKPFCLLQDRTKVFIPDWLIDRKYRLKLTPKGEDVVEQG